MRFFVFSGFDKNLSNYSIVKNLIGTNKLEGSAICLELKNSGLK